MSADKFILQLAEGLPLFYASSELQADKRTQPGESYSQHLLRGGLSGLAADYFYNPPQASDIRDPAQEEGKHAEYRSLPQPADDPPVLEQTSEAQQEHVFNAINSRKQQRQDDYEREQEAEATFRQNEINEQQLRDTLSGAFDNMGSMDLYVMAHGITSIMNQDGFKYVDSSAGDGTWNDARIEALTDVELAQFRKEEEDQDGVREGCRKFVFFDHNGDIHSYEICQDGYSRLQ